MYVDPVKKGTTILCVTSSSTIFTLIHFGMIITGMSSQFVYNVLLKNVVNLPRTYITHNAEGLWFSFPCEI